MTEPEYLYQCKSCYRCVEECTKGIFSLAVNPEYRTLGDDYWTPNNINSTWAQAHTGAVPVSGAGYRGAFSGEGFDSIWTDMSEIVRPTRDGIHGREYINTMVELSRRPAQLQFNPDMTLATPTAPILEIPLPVIFQEPEFGILHQNELIAMLNAAKRIGTLMFIKPETYFPAPTEYLPNVIPCFTRTNYAEYKSMIQNCRMVEVADEPGIENIFPKLRQLNPGLFLSIGVPLDCHAAARAAELAKTGLDSIHFYGNDHGREVGTEGLRYLKDTIPKFT
jgi:hypothetical protein